MRIHIKGKVDRARMRELAEQIADYLETAGINSWCGTNLYLTPMDPETGEPTDLIDNETGQVIEALTVSNPATPRRKVPKSAARHLRNRTPLRLVSAE